MSTDSNVYLLSNVDAYVEKLNPSLPEPCCDSNKRDVLCVIYGRICSK